MLGRIISGFIVILIGIILVGTISQEINNVFNCNSTNQTYEQPTGATDSFGGGGSEHFGGYDGTVNHKPFLSNLAPIKTDKSLLNPDCTPLRGNAKTLLSLVPIFFAIAVLLVGVAITYSNLINSGLVGGI